LNWALVVPMANEEAEFSAFTLALQNSLNSIGSGTVYLVIDKASTDNTLKLSQDLSTRDKRFMTVWAPENRNVVDAYLRGYKEAFNRGHDYIIEMDAGLSHDPAILPKFLDEMVKGHECVFGSRFVKGGSMHDSPFFRRFLSRGGTLLSNLLLGTNLKDMTSGYQGFKREIVGKILDHPLRSTAHFYQTELRYLLRNREHIEIPISYKAPSPNVSRGAVLNSFSVLLYYFFSRILGRQSAI